MSAGSQVEVSFMHRHEVEVVSQYLKGSRATMYSKFTTESSMLNQWDCVGEGGTFFMEDNLILVTKCELICRTSVDVVL